jgi:hypothetical protein
MDFEKYHQEMANAECLKGIEEQVVVKIVTMHGAVRYFKLDEVKFGEEIITIPKRDKEGDSYGMHIEDIRVILFLGFAKNAIPFSTN